MNILDFLQDIMSFVIGGGLTAIVTLRATKRKANIDVERVKMELSKIYVDEFNENITKPLKQELNAIKREVARLRKALEKVQLCPHSDNCPVNAELRKQQEAENNGANILE